LKSYITAILLLCLGLAFASGPGEEFEAKMQATQTEAEALALVNEYKDKLPGLEDLRILQNYWMRLDQDACREYFSGKHTENPDSPTYHYLWLRNLDNDITQLIGAIELIRKAPDFYWGYRLLSATYAQARLQPIPDGPLAWAIEDNETDIKALLDQGLTYFPNDDYLLIALFSHHRVKAEYDQAEAMIVRMSDPAAMEANFNYILQFVEEARRVRPFEVLFPRMLSYAISTGKVNAADSLSQYQNYYLFVLDRAEQWVKMNLFLEANPELKEQDNTLGARIDMNLGLKNYETALNLLEGALARDIVKVFEAEEDPKYEPLSALPRWNEVIANARKNWEQGRQQRKQQALASRRDVPAPLWELPDKDGKPVRLEDLKGSLVVLDFWATWCNPCRKTMPLLHKWMQGESAKGVKVFSINTWEQDPPKAAKYLQDSGYAMTLLLGNNELPKAYGFDGIPYICIIDQNGKLAFEEKGYNENLPELLDFWVEALRKP
jgi:thiol-disulfide isomerase/thioredoxin